MNSDEITPTGDMSDQGNQSADDYPVLIVLNDKHRPSQQWQIKKDSVIIGRDINCDIVTDKYQLSRQHLRIYKHGDNYWIEDLQSKNGTWLNRERLNSPQIIRDGDEIQLALTLYIIFASSGYSIPLSLDVDDGDMPDDDSNEM